MQLDDGGDIVPFRDEGDLRLGLAGLGEKLRRRQHEPFIHFDAGRLDDRAVGLEHERHRKIASVGLRGEEFAELIAVGIEQRFGAARSKAIAKSSLRTDRGMLGHIGIGHDQRLLDHGARAGREETVEPAIERRRGDDRDQNRRHRGNHRKQADDLNVQPRTGTAAAAGLNDHPYFAADDGEQQQAGYRIAEKKPDYDLVDRLDRGEAGQHQEGGGGRQQRDAHRNRADQPRGHRHRRTGPGSGGVTGIGAAADQAARPGRPWSCSFPEFQPLI